MKLPTPHYIAKTDQRKPRTCIRCDHTFSSSWPGERVCKTCNTLENRRKPLEAYGMGDEEVSE